VRARGTAVVLISPPAPSSRPPGWLAPGLLGAGWLARTLESAARGVARRARSRPVL